MRKGLFAAAAAAAMATAAMLGFSLAGFVTLYLLQRLQAYLPFNPQHQPGVAPDLAFNNAVSE